MRRWNIAVLVVGFTLVALGVHGVAAVDTSLSAAATRAAPQQSPCHHDGAGAKSGV